MQAQIYGEWIFYTIINYSHQNNCRVSLSELIDADITPNCDVAKELAPGISRSLSERVCHILKWNPSMFSIAHLFTCSELPTWTHFFTRKTELCYLYFRMIRGNSKPHQSKRNWKLLVDIDFGAAVGLQGGSTCAGDETRTISAGNCHRIASKLLPSRHTHTHEVSAVCSCGSTHRTDPTGSRPDEERWSSLESSHDFSSPRLPAIFVDPQPDHFGPSWRGSCIHPRIRRDHTVPIYAPFEGKRQESTEQHNTMSRFTLRMCCAV